ncbi:DUF4040 family protein [Enteractinococcus coprophilus]|uniref:Multisubunit sodium/proton antiporter MrpA subunit /multisubunit sodium/proton antiporter MrpB subunit n=1 Tax=Enteractinococcus coprophilus TaxID=1027633 RepID=A0A543AJ77_9MICC|nr:DUF4040 family protein [Enteractinococcus coprophilus]TQL72601.1 multisubunit sodium/proton antiporter MrpA subunit /multisubunit sodium/proton antiporter MrpB subunit [Enteractinococcus coprophilus]
MLLLAVVFSLVAVILAVPLSHWMGRYAGWLLWIPLAASAWTLSQAFASSAGEVIEYYPWIPDFFNVGFHLRLDGLSLIFGLLVTVIGAGVLFYSAKYLGTTKITSFYLGMTTFALAMLVLVLANDVMLLYVAWEATTLVSFFLIARSGSHARKPAVRTLLVTILGGLALLAAVAVMIAATGTTVITEILVSDLWTQSTPVNWLIITLAIAAFTKSAQFPFQSWLPDSMVAISPVSAYLHAAAMVKAGIYLLLLFSPVLAGNTLWLVLLVSSGLLTALMGAVSALRRYDLKELLAYSTMSQLGYLVALIGLGTPAALTAAIVHTIAHALFKSALFLAVGVIDHETGTRDMRMLTVRRMVMPATLLVIILGSASMAGVPPLLGFVSKESLFAAFLDADLPDGVMILLTVIVVLIAICTFTYSGRLVLGAMGRYRSPKHWINTPRGTGANRHTASEASATFWGYPAVNAFLSLILGIAPFMLTGIVAAAVYAVTGVGLDLELALWHGVTPALLLSILVIGLGAVAVWYLPVIEAFLVPRPLSFSGLGVVEKLRQATIEIGATVSSWTSGLNPGRHLAVPSVLLAVLALAGFLTIDSLPAQQEHLTRWSDWLLVAVVAVGVIATIRARTRVAAIAVLGTVGFAVTLWFFALGAVDVALTQLLVEVLTVVVMVLLLHRLPKTFGTTDKLSKVGLIAAIAAGTAAFAGTYALTGRRGMSEPAQYLTEQGTEVTGGNNLVNVILVEFRALDTLGELTVLGVAGVAVAALLASRTPNPVRQATILKTSPLSDPFDNSAYLRTFSKIAVPILIVFSLILLVRGHNEPGGGFVAALLTGAAFALLYLAAPTDDAAPIRWPYMGLTGAGVALGSAVGIYGLVDGSFLKPIYLDLFGFELNTSLLFDVGVYFAVLGLILGAFNMLGSERGLAKAIEVAPESKTDISNPNTKPTERVRERERVK